MEKILMYGTLTCGDCVLAKQVFAEKNIEYDYIDISNDEEATKKAIELMEVFLEPNVSSSQKKALEIANLIEAQSVSHGN